MNRQHSRVPQVGYMIQAAGAVLSRREVRYLIAGGWNTAFGIGLSFLLYWALHPYLHYMAILVVGNVIAVSAAYATYKVFVFSTKGNVLREYLRFWSVYAGAILFGLAASPFCIEVLGVNFYLSQALILVVTVVCSYVGHLNYSFKTRPTPLEPGSAAVEASKEH